MNKKTEMLKELLKNAMLESVADGEISATEAMDQILEFSAETFGELIHRQEKSSDEESKVPESIRELLQDVIQKAKGDPKLKALHCIVSGPGASEILKDIKDMFQDNDMPSGADKEEPAEEDQEKSAEDYIEELADLLKILAEEKECFGKLFGATEIVPVKPLTAYSCVVKYKNLSLKLVGSRNLRQEMTFGIDGKVYILNEDGDRIGELDEEAIEKAYEIAVNSLTGQNEEDQDNAISQNAIQEFSEFLELLVPEYDVPSDFFSQPDVKKLKDLTDYSFVVSYKHITAKVVMIDRPEGYYLFGQDGKVCIYDADGKYIRDMTSEEMDDAILG